jgi:hypothetical protein
MRTKEGSSDDKLEEQDGESRSSDTDEMLSEPSRETHASSTVPQSGSQSCDADCCSLTRDKPNQPTSNDILSSTKRMQGSQARYVQSTWFKQHTWLTICTSRRKLFVFLV